MLLIRSLALLLPLRKLLAKVLSSLSIPSFLSSRPFSYFSDISPSIRRRSHEKQLSLPNQPATLRTRLAVPGNLTPVSSLFEASSPNSRSESVSSPSNHIPALSSLGASVGASSRNSPLEGAVQGSPPASPTSGSSPFPSPPYSFKSANSQEVPQYVAETSFDLGRIQLLHLSPESKSTSRYILSVLLILLRRPAFVNPGIRGSVRTPSSPTKVRSLEPSTLNSTSSPSLSVTPVDSPPMSTDFFFFVLL